MGCFPLRSCLSSTPVHQLFASDDVRRAFSTTKRASTRTSDEARISRAAPSVFGYRGKRLAQAADLLGMKYSCIADQRAPPCPFCESEDTVVVGHNGVRGLITLCRCKRCLGEWPEAMPGYAGDQTEQRGVVS